MPFPIYASYNVKNRLYMPANKGYFGLLNVSHHVSIVQKYKFYLVYLQYVVKSNTNSIWERPCPRSCTSQPWGNSLGSIAVPECGKKPEVQLQEKARSQVQLGNEKYKIQLGNERGRAGLLIALIGRHNLAQGCGTPLPRETKHRTPPLP